MYIGIQFRIENYKISNFNTTTFEKDFCFYIKLEYLIEYLIELHCY